jgi:hypothetical protein
LANVRSTYLASVDTALNLLRNSEVERSWSTPSALEHWQVSGLCGHLARAVTLVEQYLDADPTPDGEPLSPNTYYERAIDSFDLDSELHRAIRRRGDEMAEEGARALVVLVDAVAQRLRVRLSLEPGDRLVGVMKGMVLSLDDYLATRVVELVVHIDDLAVSVGLPIPELPHDAYRLAMEVLLDIVRLRSGDLAIVRAMARPERVDPSVLHVF